VKVSAAFLDFAETHHVAASIKKKLTDSDYRLISSLNLDFIIVCGWRTLIDPTINSSLRTGLIAAHDSLLPQYRGFAPLNWAIINGDTEVGVTLFIINEGETDSGDIVMQEKVAVANEDNINDVHRRIIDATNHCYLSLLAGYAATPALTTTKQDEAFATYTCKRTPADGRIDWNASSQTIHNLVRALIYPYAGAFFFHSQKKFEVRSATLGPQNDRAFAGRIPGRVIATSETGVEVLCGSGSLLIKEVYDEGSQSVVRANQLFRSITLTLE
jgi:methionyl-tRNA formyltransferase